jgi:hypothetical protein
VAARFAANRCDLSDPFRARLSNGWVLVDRGRRKLCAVVGRDAFHGGDETVAAARQGFDETRVLMRIAESAAERLDRCIHAMLEIDEGVGGPEAGLQLFSGEQLAGLFEKQGENLEGTAGEMDLRTVFAQLAGTEINLVGVEAKPTVGRKFVAHKRSRGNGVYRGSGRNSRQRAQTLVSVVLSAYYGFTFCLPTNYLPCIERFIVWDETARAMRNEMKNSNSKIQEKKETLMKMTTVVKASMLTVALGLACLLPLTARAQSEVAPDEFAFAAAETTVAQPVVAVQAKANFEGKISLPYGVSCAGKNLEAGEYMVSVRSEGSGRVVTIHGGGGSVKMQAREVRVNQASSHSALLVRKSGQGHKVEAVYVEGLGATLYLNPSTNQNAAGMERLPIS